MKLWQTIRAKAAQLSAVTTMTGWFTTIRESFTGAWQRNVEVSAANVLAYWAVYACIKLIAGDIAKMRLKLVEEAESGIWTEIRRNSPYLKLLRKPNRYQTRVQFFTYWFTSLLIHGNTYALKERDQRGMVIALYILDPSRVTVLVGQDGSIFYQLKRDDLSDIGPDGVLVPASEIIHDRMLCLHHPLVGVSPIFACGVAATQGLAIQNNSANFFQNGSMPGGIIKVPGSIDPTKAALLKAAWESGYTGDNRGKTAILADKMEYQALTMSAHDAQLIEQLKMTAEMVCSTFGVPAWKVGVGTPPANNNIAAQDQAYYSTCLQPLIEGTEAVLDEGIGMAEANERTPGTFGVEFDLKALIRMDPMAQMDFAEKGVKSAVKTPNEARADFDLQPKEGGDELYLQQQNFSLSALAKRDASEDPFGTAKPPAPAPAPVPEEEDEPEVDPEAIADAAGKAAAAAVERALVDITARVNSIAAAVASPPAPPVPVDLLGQMDLKAFEAELEASFTDG